MLSKGLPPPLLVLPDLIDCASAGEVLVLLADVDFACEEFDVVGGVPMDVVDEDCCVVDNVVLCFIDADVADAEVLESVINPVVTGFVEERTIVLVPIDLEVGIGIRGMLLVPRPVVVVTTATLHSSCIALPSLNNPMMLVSSTSADWQLLATSALI
jgi:hypothetical protein